MKPRIAYMTGEYPRPTDTFITREIEALRALGFSIDTFSIRRPGAGQDHAFEREAERARTFYVLDTPWLRILAAQLVLLTRSPGRYLRALSLALTTSGPGLGALLYQLFYFVEAGVVARELLRRDLQHLHNHFGDSSCTVAMLAAELSGRTFSATVHGPAEFFEPARWRLDAKLERALFLCCISHFCRSQVMAQSAPELWDRLHIVHCGVDPTLFTPRAHHGDARSLLFVGRLAPVKGLPVLLEAFARVAESHPTLVLELVGDGPSRAELERQAVRLGIGDRVRFLGYLSQAQVRERLATADVFVLSSFAEGLPVVLMEAMAAGVPVIATRIAGIPELVRDGESGFLTAPGDVDALSERIRTLVEKPELRAKLAREARTEVEREFNQASEAARLSRLLSARLAGLPCPIRVPADGSTERD